MADNLMHIISQKKHNKKNIKAGGQDDVWYTGAVHAVGCIGFTRGNDLFKKA